MTSVRYTKFSAEAVFSRDVTATELRVLAALGTYANGQGLCHPSQTTLAERLGITRQTVSSAIKKLVSKGYIETAVRTAPGRGKAGYEYRIVLDSAFKPNEADVGAARQRHSPTTAGADVGADKDPTSGGADNRKKEHTQGTHPPAAVATARALPMMPASSDSPPPPVLPAWQRVCDAVNSPWLDPNKTQRLVLEGDLVQRWIDAGCDEERDIVPIVREMCSRKNERQHSWDYFTSAVRRAAARRLKAEQPMDIITPSEARNHDDRSDTSFGQFEIRRGKISPADAILLKQMSPRNA